MFDMNGQRNSAKEMGLASDRVNSEDAAYERGHGFGGAERKAASASASKHASPRKVPNNLKQTGEYMYVEMAHYTDDDTVVLICVTNSDSFIPHEYKLEKL